ncbi:MAG: toxin-activating lysine-acyltransferase [Pseudomonadota bacterium]
MSKRDEHPKFFEPLPDDGTGSAVFGQMVWLYSMSSLHRNWAMSSLHRWVLPPLRHKQYRLYHRGMQPVGLVTWAHMSDDVELAYVRNTQSLTPNDWVSGKRSWIIDFIAPFGDALKIGHDLRTNVFPNDVGRILQARPGSDTMTIAYIHGANAREKARDPKFNPPVLSQV